MTPAALIATMVALAAPNAHGPIKVDCNPALTYGGVAYPWDGRIELSQPICKLNFRTILHRNVTPLQAEIGTMDLLHEASHVGQWREGDRFTNPARPYEHDAECRALNALPRALRTLRYRKPFIGLAVAWAKQRILIEQAPYGGSC